jgi:hypothetical protein
LRPAPTSADLLDTLDRPGTLVLPGRTRSWSWRKFSDGASYALTLGLTNGDLLDSVLAFSPGFAAPMVTHGAPRVSISHSDDDRVLPIDRCCTAPARTSAHDRRTSRRCRARKIRLMRCHSYWSGEQCEDDPIGGSAPVAMAETGVPASCAFSLGLSNGDMGYDVTYEEFAGCHVVPARLVRQAMAWFPRRRLIAQSWTVGVPTDRPTTVPAEGPPRRPRNLPPSSSRLHRGYNKAPRGAAVLPQTVRYGVSRRTA